MKQYACVLVLSLFLFSAYTYAQDVERYTLDNGLRVRLQHATDGDLVAMIMLFDIGEQHNPVGKSGLAHYIEHLYVTCAAGSTPVRTADEMYLAYPKGSNAQTGIDYTVVATVFTVDQLENEIADAAARMSELKIEASDLERELPRLELELGNMYGGMPQLATMNLARDAVDPLGPGARRGGVMEQLHKVTLEEARAWHEKYYKPNNAILILVGGFDPDSAQAFIRKSFGAILPGQELPTPEPAKEPGEGDVITKTLVAPRFGTWPKEIAVQARRAPDPASKDYASFLIILSKLQMLSMPQMQKQMMQQRQGVMSLAPVQYTPLDAPRVFYLNANSEDGWKEEADLKRVLDQRIADLLELEINVDNWRQACMSMYGFMLGLAELPPRMMLQNPYFVAFSMGRMEQMGIDAEALLHWIKTMTADDIREAIQEQFVTPKGVICKVRIQ